MAGEKYLADARRRETGRQHSRELGLRPSTQPSRSRPGTLFSRSALARPRRATAARPRRRGERRDRRIQITKNALGADL